MAQCIMLSASVTMLFLSCPTASLSLPTSCKTKYKRQSMNTLFLTYLAYLDIIVYFFWTLYFAEKKYEEGKNK